MSDFSFLSSTNSSGPLPQAEYSGSGYGYYDSNTGNNGHACGTPTPSSPVSSMGAAVDMVGWSTANGGIFAVVLQGTRAQNYFASVTLSGGLSLTLPSSSATLDTTSIPGYTIWVWSGHTEGPGTIGENIAVSFSAGGKGPMTDPQAWQSVTSGDLPPDEYDGVPGGGQV